MTAYEPMAPIQQRNVVLLAGGPRALTRTAELVAGCDRLIVVAAAHFHAEPGLTEGAHIDPSGLRQGREGLDDAAAFFAELGIAAETVLAQGNAADVVVKVAEQCNADLIIVGNGAPTVLDRLGIASLTGRLAQRAPCDVLIVH
jgi:nucleotide-binding universal stress UspA family protein